MKGGPQQYEHGKEWQAAEIVGVKPSSQGIQYRVTWLDYDQTYDTWEPRENILDASLIEDYDATVQLTIPLEQPMWQLREEVAKMLMGIKRPMQGMEVEVPLASYLEVARAVIRRATKPPSCRGGKPLEIEYDQGARWRTMQLQPRGAQRHRVAAPAPAPPRGRLRLRHLQEGARRQLQHDGAGRPPPAHVLRAHAARRRRVQGGRVLHGDRQRLGVQRPRRLRPGGARPAQRHDARPSPRVPQERASRPRALGAEAPPHPRWAELPTKRAALTEEEAHPRRNVTRARAGPSTGGEAPPPMGSLE